jgi:predicted enzyme related to lactoylglutathione lyase
VTSSKELFMEGVKTLIYPVQDLDKAKAVYGALLGVEPYVDAPYYVGFRVGDQEIGLDPSGHAQGMTMPVGYYEVPDIAQSLQALLGAGGQAHQEVKDVGGGKLTAAVRDADGNLIGLIQSR